MLFAARGVGVLIFVFLWSCRGEIFIQFSDIVVFGDDWSDNHNTFALTHGQWPPAALYPLHTFTNGPMWMDYLFSMMKQQELLREGARLLTYAYGGATTDSDIVQGYTGPVPSIPTSGALQQLEGFNETLDYSTTLFVVWAGVNNLLFAENSSLITVQQAALGQVDIIYKLWQRGAKYFLAPTQWDLSHAPIVTDEDAPSLQTALGGMKQYFGAYLFRFELTVCLDCVYYVPDFFLFSNLVIQNRTQFGFNNTDTPCIDTSGGSIKVCPDATDYLWWDPLHYTTKMHDLMARLTLQEMLTVPNTTTSSTSRPASASRLLSSITSVLYHLRSLLSP